MVKGEVYVSWQVRVRKELDDKLQKVCNDQTFTTKSEFIRQAVREKMERQVMPLAK